VKTRKLARYILAADVLWIPIALAVAYVLRYGLVWHGPAQGTFLIFLPPIIASLVLWVFLSSWMKLDCFRGGWRFPAVVSQVFLAVCSLMGLLLAVSYLAGQYLSRLALSYFGILLLIGFIVIRYAARLLLRARYLAGAVRKVVIMGAGRVARELAIKIERHPEMLCRVVGYLFPEDNGADLRLGPSGTNSAVTASTLEVVELLRTQEVDELILALTQPAWPEVLNLAGRCREYGISVSIVPQPYELYLSKPDLLDLDGLPVLQLQDPSISPPLRSYLKRMVDIVVSSLLSVVATPVAIPIGIWLREKKGRAFRWESRCGQRGRLFSMLRFNVDRPATHASGFERALEKLSVTELPQLWNVLRGEMSLVGPRPEPLERVRCYSEWQRQRLSVKPGMTGLAQVHGLRDHHSSEEKTRFDLQYLLNPSPLTDLSLLLQTVSTLATRLFQYSRLVTPVSAIAEQSVYHEFTSNFVQETLQSAHRSQSGSD
jgi:lipopolysaccharide/colanic/teichoic acid biosynthesis glycosyltransferase